MLRSNALIDAGSGAISWILKSNGRIVGISAVAVLLSIAVFQDLISPYSLSERFPPFLHPSLEHLLGTNDVGKDIFAELVHGARISLSIGFLAAAISLGIGVTVGTIAGYYRGKVESFVLAMTDVVIVIPTLPLLLIFVVYMSPGIISMSLAISILGWGGMARILHPRVMTLKEMPFIEAARSMGRSDIYIIVKHVIPNCKEIIWAKFAMAVGGAILAESSMAFLGLGDPLHLSWGGIINEAYTHGGLSLGLWWWYTIPGMLIALVILAFMFIGNSKGEDKWGSK